jgi:hypothetical protein
VNGLRRRNSRYWVRRVTNCEAEVAIRFVADHQTLPLTCTA